MSLSITAYNDPVAVVNIPVSLSHDYTTKIYWTIDKVQSELTEFFNITSNRIEIAIFASVDLVFAEWSTNLHPAIRINSPWRVFEITSGDDGGEGNYDSPHLRRLSEPLAEAKISILYHPSYFTDFLLVKESDFEKASAIFEQHGWQVTPSSASSTPRRRSQLLTPNTPYKPPTSGETSPTPPPPQPEIIVLPTPLACVGLDRTAERRSGERIRKFIVWPERTIEQLREKDECADDDQGETSLDDTETSRSRSESDVSASIDQLPSDPKHPSLHLDIPTSTPAERPFISYTRTQDGASLLTEVRVLQNLFPRDGEDAVELQSGGELGWDTGSVDSEDEWEVSDDGLVEDDDESGDVRMADDSDMVLGEGSSVASYSGLDESSSYFHNKSTEDVQDNDDIVHFFTRRRLSTPMNDIFPMDPDSSPNEISQPLPPSLHLDLQEDPDNFGTWPQRKVKFPRPISLPARLTLDQNPIIPIKWPSATPRTSLPRSLSRKTVDSIDLSHLTPPPSNGSGSHSDLAQSVTPKAGNLVGTEGKRKRGNGMKRCLQLDLRGLDEDGRESRDYGFGGGAYHLDKSGLVTRFSDLLESGNIKMLYSSTYHTANILVDEGDVRRAKRLLERRRRKSQE